MFLYIKYSRNIHFLSILNTFFSLFLKYSYNIERVTFWGVWDGNSWRNYLPMIGRTDYPLIFDRDFKKKPAYYALKNLVTKKE